MPAGLFITFEGGEGSGKSTQVTVLRRRLQRRGVPCTVVREPGGTPLGRSLRRILKFSSSPLAPMTEVLLFNASRAQLVTQVIQPALSKGMVVLCDRFADSTLAYQGYGRGVSLEVVEMVNRTATENLKADLTIFLDISPEEGLKRRSGARDRFEKDALDFHRRVHQGYLDLSRSEPERWLVVDARRSPREVASHIWQRVEPLIAKMKSINHPT